MRLAPHIFFLFLACLAIGSSPARAQALVDTVFAWQGYGRMGQCRLRVYTAPPREDRTYTIVIQELAENGGPSTANDIKHLAELAGRTFGIDPSAAFWILHWGAFSFEGARPEGRKELFIRATFRRIKSGGIGSPSWRVLSREEVEELTDRQFD